MVAWSAIRPAIRPRSLRCVLTYKSTFRALLAIGGASQDVSHSNRPCLHLRRGVGARA
ncbi:MAG: hypothetical protein RL701_4466 [Pseudomonadota bacterium]